MDESAFYYCMMPITSVTKGKMAGRKKIKKRLTVAITTNANGSSTLCWVSVQATEFQDAHGC